MDSKLDDKQWVIEYISNWIKKATRFKVEIIRLIPQNEECENCGHGNKYHTPKVNSPLKGCHFCLPDMKSCICKAFSNSQQSVQNHTHRLTKDVACGDSSRLSKQGSEKSLHPEADALNSEDHAQ